MKFKACEKLKRFDEKLAEWICSLSQSTIDDIEERAGTIQIPVLKLNTELSRQKFCYYEHDELFELPYPLQTVPIKIFPTYVIWNRKEKKIYRNFFDEYVARKFPKPDDSIIFTAYNVAFYIPEVHKIGFIIGVRSAAEFVRDFKDSMKTILSERKRNGEEARLSSVGILLKSKKRILEKNGKKVTFYVPEFEVKGDGVDADFGIALKEFIEEYREYRKRINVESLRLVEDEEVESEDDIDGIDF